MSLLSIVLLGWLGVAAVMAALWVWQRQRGNAGIVDVAWSLGTGLLGAWFALMANGNAVRRGVVAGMVLIWGARLGLHLIQRMRRETEDGRYQQMRRKWGEHTQRNLFLFFQVQALWAVMFAAPMLAAAQNPAPLSWLDALGLVIWLTALTGESIADRQLARFKADPANRGHVCRVGLWHYSRHPNYFFEWLHWWAYVCLAVGSPLWWIPPLAVLVMLLFLTRITGIPPTEAQALRSRGDAYRDYQRTTSAFFLWPPREEHAR